MKRELVIGLDLGTTSVKAVIFTTNGKHVVAHEKMITSMYPKEHWVEQSPQEIETISREVLKEVIEKGNIQPGEIIAIGFSNAMHSLLCIDKQMKPLSNAIIWSDRRSYEQAKRLRQTKGHDIFLRTGTPIHPMSPFLKLLWMKETNYEPYLNATYFMSIKEYIIQKWFGCRWIDYSTASATGLLNLKTLYWDEEALSLVNVDEEQLSTIVPPTTLLPPIGHDLLKEIPILKDVPFVIGSCDGQLANLGDGATEQGEIAITVGTSGAIRQMTSKRQVNPTGDTFTYLFTDNRSIIGGPTNNGGIVLQWLKDVLHFSGSYEEFLCEAEKSEVGANQLLFFPYINGERAPLWNENAQGVFFGLKITHKREHLIRAALEGISFNLYQIATSLEKVAGKAKRISVNGGLSRSPLWVQMMADLFGQDIHVLETHHSAAWGAAWLSLVGIGYANSLEEIKKNIHVKAIVSPNSNHHKIYQNIYRTYEELSKNFEIYFL